MNIYSISITNQASKESLGKMFELMDIEHQGELTAECLMELAKKVRMPLSKVHADLIIEMHSKNA